MLLGAAGLCAEPPAPSPPELPAPPSSRCAASPTASPPKALASSTSTVHEPAHRSWRAFTAPGLTVHTASKDPSLSLVLCMRLPSMAPIRSRSCCACAAAVVTRSRICARTMPMSLCSSWRITSRACCFALRLTTTLKWMRCSARSTRLTVMGWCVAASTHFSATMVATSWKSASSCAWRSLSDTWSSPFCRMSTQIASSSRVPKAASRSSPLAATPLLTLLNTCRDCSTSSRSRSTPLRQLSTLLG
mmetsp:Transcript_3016/g.9909  ORF Transcript_3016/g.9909 Transcript_3016/m.9909 type:complete len:247 (+) Transcript_3016:341-1081(+)